MSKYAATDETGRPIVAELGRAETPDEAADRRAASSKEHREGQTVLNLVIALVASLVIVGVIVLAVVRPNPAPAAPVDYVSIAQQAQPAFGATVVAPPLPSGWNANRAQLDDSATVPTWGVGFVTPHNSYLAITEAVKADPTWVADAVAQTAPAGTTTIDGVTWTVYDRRAQGELDNVAYALVTTSGDATIVLSGTADDDEFRTLAAAVADQLR